MYESVSNPDSKRANELDALQVHVVQNCWDVISGNGNCPNVTMKQDFSLILPFHDFGTEPVF